MPPLPAEPLTLLRQAGTSRGAGRLSSALPPDLLVRVRSRVRLLALLLFFAFAVDPLIYLGGWAATVASGSAVSEGFRTEALFQWISAGGAAVSGFLWWATRQASISPARLHTIGLVYEVVICLLIALITNWQQFVSHGTLPNLTWVPAVVILFPLLLPGRPSRMLTAAIAAAATAPLALVTLDLLGLVVADGEDITRAVFSSTVGVIFASVGARVVYGLGREVMAARELGSYRLEERLGHGGMGEVWRARHRMLARPAAIKLIRASATSAADQSETLTRRFEREAQVIASLRSPHTVTLFDFGVADNGAFYYAMELLDGIDAESLVRRFGPVPHDRVVHVLRQMCHSLSEADARGLVHRDIKPANVFLCRYGEDVDFVKVLDFGLVTAFDGAGDDLETEVPLTRVNVVQGTPAYIAPEQALGERAVDGRVDVYATGCVAYWLLTGQQVFTADTPMALLMHHVHTPPDPPSSRTEAAIPFDLETLVMACLAKAPADRPASARELSRRLSALAGADTWTDERAHEWWRQHLPALRTTS